MKRKLIESMVILPENLEYIGKYGKINGMLLVEIERIMEEYAAIKVREAQAECTIPVVSGSLPLDDEDVLEPIQNALYATHAFSLDDCTGLASGILSYLKEAGFAIVRGNDR